MQEFYLKEKKYYSLSSYRLYVRPVFFNYIINVTFNDFILKKMSYSMIFFSEINRKDGNRNGN